MKKSEIKAANATSRCNGAVSSDAIVPRLVVERCSKEESILDFGAGKSARHTMALKKQGFNITAYEFGDNIVRDLHDPNALERQYDTVFASNVLNVQMSLKMLGETLAQIKKALKPGGRLIANYPDNPRKLNIIPQTVRHTLEKRFGEATLINGSESPSGSPVWEIINLKSI